MKIRRVISLTLFISFIVMVYSGIMLFLCPQGRVAYWTGWRLLGLSKEQYGEIHTTCMILFIVSGIWHITLNWNPIKSYLKNRSREMRVFTREFNVALLLVVAFIVGTLSGAAPWSSLLTWGESVKDYWERRDGSPPWGHAEENTLARFTRGLVGWERLEHGRSVRLPVESALAALRNAGLVVENEEQPLIDIARTNHTTPQALMGILREAELPLPEDPDAAAPARTGEGPFPVPLSGLGRMRLRDYSEKYSLDLDSLLALFPNGVAANPDRTLRELANELHTDPEGVIEVLNEKVKRVAP